jgi:holo-[acyl-carrier protein] synthase
VIIGSGVDVIEIARIEAVLRRRGDRFERRVFTRREIEQCHRAGRPAPHFAVRFAAKEAVMKAVGTGWAHGVRWVDIETREQASTAAGVDRISERLQLSLHGAVAERCRELAERLCGSSEGSDAAGSLQAHLAVGRSRTHAVATVLLEDRRW